MKRKLYIYVPYDPGQARLVRLASDESAIRWFKKKGKAESSAQATLIAVQGHRFLASYGDGEFYQPKGK